MDINEKQQAILDIKEEINVVLSIKDHISEEEIKNLTEGFKALNERDIRELLVNITGDSIYIENFKEENEIAKKEEVIEEKVAIEEKPLIKEKIIIKLPDTKPKANAENISVIREEVRYNQLCIEWDWPVLIEKVMVCYRNDKFPSKPEDKDSNKFIVERRMEEKTGEFIINKLREESYYFWVFPIVNEGDNVKYLEGKKRLVVNKAIVEIFYEFKVKKSLFGQVKSVKILLKTNEEEVTLPPTSLIAKKGSVPIFKSDGNENYKLDYIKIEKDITSEIDVPADKISKNTYVKLFIDDEKSSFLYRLIPPRKENMYF